MLNSFNNKQLIYVTAKAYEAAYKNSPTFQCFLKLKLFDLYTKNQS